MPLLAQDTPCFLQSQAINLRFTPFSGHGLCGVCRGVGAAELIVEWADVSDL